jgi:signal transduction histidine kinase
MLLEGIIDEPTESQRAILRKAYESNERQLRIVADLLKVARVDAGKVMLKKNPTDLNQLVGDVVREQKEIAKVRKQQVEFIPSEHPAIADVDKDTIRMVFENLVDNASKYSGEETTIGVGVAMERSAVIVRVSDQGVGIDPADQGKLFAKFSRIHNPLSAQVGGTGLGLYWAKKIIDLHGGTIRVDSKVGDGTTFQVGLPKSL